MNVLVTGAAGFIGSKVAENLLEKGHSVTGIDNLNDYYDPRLKKDRLEALRPFKKFTFRRADIENRRALAPLYKKGRYSAVVNLAARAGVPYSVKNPFIYVTTNTLGTLNLLDLCREYGVKKFIVASTSSLYNENDRPFREDQPANAPLSPYAASKKGAEAMSHSYHFLHGIDVTVLRYFTVYGPAGRPDMSPFRFIEWIRTGKPLLLNGDGRQSRDFTYVDDIADGTVRAVALKGYQTINLGGNKPHSMLELIRLMEKHIGKKALIKHRPALRVDMKTTWADISKARKLLGWRPEVSLDLGIGKTVAWHLKAKPVAYLTR